MRVCAGGYVTINSTSSTVVHVSKSPILSRYGIIVPHGRECTIVTSTLL